MKNIQDISRTSNGLVFFMLSLPLPLPVELGKFVAQIFTSKGYIFPNAKNTRKLMEYMGNPSSNLEKLILSPLERRLRIDTSKQ
jgi:hypothetical protein